MQKPRPRVLGSSGGFVVHTPLRGPFFLRSEYSYLPLQCKSEALAACVQGASATGDVAEMDPGVRRADRRADQRGAWRGDDWMVGKFTCGFVNCVS